MASGGNTLSKAERLSGKKSISTLLADGRWGSLGHFRYCWMARPEGPCPSSQKNAHQGRALPAGLSADGVLPTSNSGTSSAGVVLPGRILVSVPKRFFKRAVKRNLLKRRIREAYRVRKIAGVDVMFQYNSAELAPFTAISADVAAILSRISAALPEPAGKKTPENLPEP